MEAQRRRAREALVRSCVASGIPCGPFDKDACNVPRPFSGNYWSISHKPRYVAAVVSSTPIGIDLEEITPRNKALFGAWSQDQWNPVFIAPVFTALEYASFRAFGVGVRQARLAPELCGLASVWLMGLGVARLAGRRAGVIAALLLGTNYIYVMWNRAALMEGPMVAFMVAGWYFYVRTQEDARWGLTARACA